MQSNDRDDANTNPAPEESELAGITCSASCEDCGWTGKESELSPPVKSAPMPDYDGPFCPKCGSDAVDVEEPMDDATRYALGDM